jgi:hypothetical protein
MLLDFTAMHVLIPGSSTSSQQHKHCLRYFASSLTHCSANPANSSPQFFHHATLSPTFLLAGEQCTRGALARANDGEEGAAGWWPISPSSRWGGRRTTPASWPATTKRTCPVTAESRPLVRRRRQEPRAAGRSIAGGVPGHVRGPGPHQWRTAGSSAWPQRRARL